MKYLFLRFFSLSLLINFVCMVHGNEIINAIQQNQDEQTISKCISENLSMLNDDSTGTTPLHVAVECENGRAVSLLLNNQADANVRNQKRETPLHVAARKGNLPIATQLTDAGAALNEQDQDGNTALHHAIAFSKTQLAFLLILRNADVTVSNTNSLTPLHQAAEGIESSLVRLLLTHDACVHVKDNLGRTPLHHCALPLACTLPLISTDALRSRKEIATLLVQYGASLDVPNNDGKSPSQLLQQTNRPEISNFLDTLRQIR